jgi:hypothetical protein
MVVRRFLIISHPSIGLWALRRSKIRGDCGQSKTADGLCGGRIVTLEYKATVPRHLGGYKYDGRRLCWPAGEPKFKSEPCPSASCSHRFS